MQQPDLSTARAADATLQGVLTGEFALPVRAVIRAGQPSGGSMWASTLGGAIEALEALWGVQLDDCVIIRREVSGGDSMLLERWILHARDGAPVPWSMTAEVRLEPDTGGVVANFDRDSVQVGSSRYPRPIV